MRAKPPSRSSRATRNVSKPRPKSNEKKMENINNGPKNTQIADLAVLRQPIDSSVAGLKQACKLFETGTPEMLNILSYECDIVYECKVCRNLFRSLVNFISHKRVYCTKHYSRSQDLLSSNQQVEDHTVIIDTKNSSNVRPTRITVRRDLTSIVENVSSKVTASQFYIDAANKVSARNSARKDTTLHLQPMENTTYGVFQTVVNNPTKELMKNQVSELHNMLSEEENVPTLGPDGRILTKGVIEKKEDIQSKQVLSGVICPKCNVKFSTRKTLTQHIKTVHECIKICYTCPVCKNQFANSWSVYRHLYKIHRKTNEQVRKLRTQIQKKEIRIEKNKTPGTQNDVNQSQSEQHRLEQENKAWMEHFEDDFELQRCGGCGRRFERKAALTSHSQICQKRIAACSRIQKDPDSPSKITPISIPAKPMPVVPKLQSEKKIGIQVRMNYCKTGSSSTTQSEERRNTRLGLGDESDAEAASVDGKYPPSSHSSVEVRSNAGIDNFLQMHKGMESNGSIDKVKIYLNNVVRNRKREETDVQSNTHSSDFPKVGKLEAKCLQLRKALEVDDTELNSVLVDEPDKEKPFWDSSEIEDPSVENKTEYDNSKGLPSEATFPAFKDETLVAVKTNIVNEPIKSDLSEDIQLPEADSTSVSSGSVEIIFEHLVSENEVDTTVENNENSNELFKNLCDKTNEISTSELTVDVPNIQNEIIINQNETSVIKDGIIHINDENSEESGSSKENHLESCISNIKCDNNDSVTLENDFLLENTISILTRNQLKAICKDDVIKEEKEPQTNNLHSKKSLKSINEENNGPLSRINRSLLKHMRMRKMQCLICLKKYRSILPLRYHVAAHTGLKAFRCLSPDCTFNSLSRAECISHLLKSHLKASEKDLASSMVAAISPAELKTNFNCNKTYPLVGVKSGNLRNSARIKTKNYQINGVQNSPSKIRVVENTDKIQICKNTQKSPATTIAEPTTKKRRVKEENGKVSSGRHDSIEETKKTHVSSSEAQNVGNTFSVNMTTNSNKDPFVATEEETVSSDMEEIKVVEESQGPDNSNLQELVMEVIFGTNNTATNNSLISGRPIRNKMRPKRDSDFIFEHHKDNTSEANNSRNGPLRKSLRNPDSKSELEPPKKCK